MTTNISTFISHSLLLYVSIINGKKLFYQSFTGIQKCIPDSYRWQIHQYKQDQHTKATKAAAAAYIIIITFA